MSRRCSRFLWCVTVASLIVWFGADVKAQSAGLGERGPAEAGGDQNASLAATGGARLWPMSIDDGVSRMGVAEIGAPLPTCPANTINNPPVGQPPSSPFGSWYMDPSEVSANEVHYERFVGVSGPICDVHFWGFMLEGMVRRGIPECVEDPITFEINFYEDVPARRGILTMPGPLVCTYTVDLSGTPTPVPYGAFTLWEFGTQLSPCCDMTTGWVSIQAVSDPTCWFWIVSSNEGDGMHWSQDLSGFNLETWDMAMCLTPRECPPTEGVSCEPQGGDNPVHPPGYFYDVAYEGFCDFHVRVFDPDPCHYANWLVPENWLYALHEVDGEWWASWWDPSGQCDNAIMDCFRFGFDNSQPSVWGDWTITIGNSPDPYYMVQDSSADHAGEPDGTGYRVHVPLGPDPAHKWVQLPDLNDTGADVAASNLSGPLAGVAPYVLADDFECSFPGPLTEITVWGSWYDDTYPAGDPGAVAFMLSIHEDIPAPRVAGIGVDYSMPGDLHCPLMYFEPGTFTVEPCAVDLDEGFIWPNTSGGYYEPSADTICWKYTFPLDETCLQFGTPGQPVVYWLDVQAFPTEPTAVFGWKTSLDHWNDNAVFGIGLDPPPMWYELVYPPGHAFDRAPVDLAFAVDSTELTECMPTPSGDGCVPVACPGVGEVCRPSCVEYDPESGEMRVTECTCAEVDECRVDMDASPGPVCVDPAVGGNSELPAEACDYASPEDVWLIVDGLPPGTTMELDGPITDLSCGTLGVPGCGLMIPPGECEVAGGVLGGHGHCYTSVLDVTLTGTGSLAGFVRSLSIPIELNEVHTASRVLSDPAQSLMADYVRLYGHLVGDPDFDVLEIVAGTDYGLPSPGEITLTQLPTGDYAIDSFFDITYRIDFVGAPGGVLDGYSGSTTSQIRVEMGSALPGCIGSCTSPQTCDPELVLTREGGLGICCGCVGGIPCSTNTECVIANDNCCEWDQCGSVTAGQCDPVVPMMYGDVTGAAINSPPNGVVNTTDVLCVLGAFGVGNMEYCANADIAIVGPANCPSGNSVVNLTDILKVLDAFGAPAPGAVQMCACPLNP